MKLIVSPEALNDLRQIEQYIGSQSPKAAVEFVGRLTERFQDLFPQIGRTRDEFKPNYRSITEKDYVIFYRVQSDTVQILHVLHGKRDLRRALGK